MSELNAFLAAPELFLVAIGFVIIIAAMNFRHSQHVGHTLSWVGIGALGVALLYILLGPGVGKAFYGTFHVDGLALFFKVIFLIAGIMVLLLTYDYMVHYVYKGEFVALLLFSVAAMMFLASANEMMTMFLALETTTLTFYFFSAYRKNKPKSAEAGLKMFIQGLLSSAILLYGLSLFFGMTGTTFLDQMMLPLSAYGNSMIFVVALVFVTAGFGFKVAIAPFHMWVPDVYEGAPTPVTAFLSVASKAAGLVVLTRFLYVAVGGAAQWQMLFVVLSVLTMTIGNLIAISASNIKRMMAFSSIAHVGYMLIGIVAYTHNGLSSLLFYILVYGLGNLLIFASIIAVSEKVKSHEIASYAGLGRNSPFVAFSMLMGFLSLIGIPPLGGFVGKLFLFGAGIEQGYYLLAGLGVLNSILSVYYYLNVVRYMYLEKGKAKVKFTPTQMTVAVACLALLLVFGLYPELILGWFAQFA